MSQEYNEYKWAKAAAAARDVMELPGENNGRRYELYHKKLLILPNLDILLPLLLIRMVISRQKHGMKVVIVI